MNKHLLSGLAGAGIFLFACFAPAEAAPIKYTLQDVTFTDGATASGYFTYDADIRHVYDFQVSTTVGVLDAFTFEKANSWYSYPTFGPNSFFFITKDSGRYFNFSFLIPLGTEGGRYELNTDYTYECNNCGTYRHISGGYIMSEVAADVPEPGTLALLLPSLAAVGLIARRRKQHAA